MSARIDIISPDYIGEDCFTLALEQAAGVLYAHIPFTVTCDYSGAGAYGAKYPLEVVFHGPKPGIVNRRIFYSLPSSYVFTPTCGGEHLILVKELHHNEWQGRLIVNVLGDDLTLGDG